MVSYLIATLQKKTRKKGILPVIIEKQIEHNYLFDARKKGTQMKLLYSQKPLKSIFLCYREVYIASKRNTIPIVFVYPTEDYS